MRRSNGSLFQNVGRDVDGDDVPLRKEGVDFERRGIHVDCLLALQVHKLNQRCHRYEVLVLERLDVLTDAFGQVLAVVGDKPVGNVSVDQVLCHSPRLNGSGTNFIADRFMPPAQTGRGPVLCIL